MVIVEVKKALGKENTDTPDMDAFLEQLYTKNSFGGMYKPNEMPPRVWWCFYTPKLQIPKYARDKGLSKNIDPNNPYGKPKKDDPIDIYKKKDEIIRDKIKPRLADCLDRARGKQ